MTASDEREAAEWLLERLRSAAYTRKETVRALTELGPPYQAAAHAELMRLLAANWTDDPARDLRLGDGDGDGAFQRLYTARALGALGPQYVTDAAQALRSVLNVYPGWVRVQAARELGALGEPYRPEAARALRAEVGPEQDQYYGGTDLNLDAACAFATWGPAWRQESVRALRLLAGDRHCYRLRPRAALALAELGEEYRAEALAAALDAVAAGDFPGYKAIREAAQAALTLSPASAGQVAEILRGHLAAADPDGGVHPQAALALSDLGPGYAEPGHAEEAATVLRSVVDGGAEACEA